MSENAEKKVIVSDNWDSLGKMQKIDFESGKFEANGKTYYLETKLSIARFCEFQVLEKEMAMGMTIKEIYEGLQKNDKLLNQQRFVDCAVFNRELINHCAMLTKKEPVILKICTLLINTENEDRSKWDNDLVVRKLDDWKAANIDVNDFFYIAFALVPGYINVYNLLTQSILENLQIAKDIVDALKK